MGICNLNLQYHITPFWNQKPSEMLRMRHQLCLQYVLKREVIEIITI